METTRVGFAVEAESRRRYGTLPKDIVGWGIEIHPAILTDEASKIVFSFPQDLLDQFFIKVDAHRGQPPAKVSFDHRFHTWEAGLAHNGFNLSGYPHISGRFHQRLGGDEYERSS